MRRGQHVRIFHCYLDELLFPAGHHPEIYKQVSAYKKTRLSLVQIFPSNKDAAVATLTLLLLFIWVHLFLIKTEQVGQDTQID